MSNAQGPDRFALEILQVEPTKNVGVVRRFFAHVLGPRVEGQSVASLQGLSRIVPDINEASVTVIRERQFISPLFSISMRTSVTFHGHSRDE